MLPRWAVSVVIAADMLCTRTYVLAIETERLLGRVYMTKRKDQASDEERLLLFITSRISMFTREPYPPFGTNHLLIGLRAVNREEFEAREMRVVRLRLLIAKTGFENPIRIRNMDAAILH
jgi:hypothetical protein